MEKRKTPPPPEEIQDMVMDALSPSPIHSVSFTFITFLLTRILNELVPYGTPAPASTTPTSPKSRPGDQGRQHSQATRVLLPRPPHKRQLLKEVSSSIASPSNAQHFIRISHWPQKRILLHRKGGRPWSMPMSMSLHPSLFDPENEASLKGKDKKALDARKKRVLEAFLSTRQL